MAESTHEPYSSMKDDGKRLRMRNKSIRMEGSSHLTPRAPFVGDHFLGTFDSALTGSWYKTVIVSSTGTATITQIANAPGGAIRLATTAASDAGVGYGAIATGQLAFRPDKLNYGEKIVFEARIRTVTGTTLDVSFGLHDLQGEATKPYLVDSTSTLTTNLPTDFAGFIYSSTPTSGILNINGTTTNYIGIVNSCADTDVLASTGLANDLKWHIYRVEVDVAGNVGYFVDDVQVYRQAYSAAATGLTPTAPLCGSVSLSNVGQTVASVDVDYLYVGGALDLTS